VLATIDTPALATGGSVEVTYQWNASTLSGQHSITVTADEASQVDESNEGNNSSTAQYALKNGRI